MTITTQEQADKAAKKVAAFLWGRVAKAQLTFEQAEELAPRCIEFVFDGLTPAKAVAKAVAEAA